MTAPEVDRSGPQPRRRARRYDGPRTTLRLPAELAALAEEVAREQGTTPNDALVLLALEGAQLYTRRRELERTAQARRRAFVESFPPATSTYPSLEEMQEAALLMRREFASDEE
jgi:hypothetical protein